MHNKMYNLLDILYTKPFILIHANSALFSSNSSVKQTRCNTIRIVTI